MNFLLKLTGTKEKDGACCKIEIKETEADVKECCSSDSEEDQCCA